MFAADTAKALKATIGDDKTALLNIRLQKTKDRVARLDIKTGNFTEYLLPRSTNIRRVFTDNTTSPPTLWVGNNHGASIVKVETLQ